MAKVLGKLRLAPNVTAWCDEVNHIYLRRPQHTCKDIMEGTDLEPIMKGVNAGYVIFNDVKPEVKKAPAVSVNVKVNNIKENIKKKRKIKEEPKQEVVEEVKEEVVEEVKEEVKIEEPKEDK